MGLTSVEIEVGNPSNLDVTEKVEFIVDSGAFFSVVPAAVLEKLGIKPVAEEIFRLANGDKIKRKKGLPVSPSIPTKQYCCPIFRKNPGKNQRFPCNNSRIKL